MHLSELDPGARVAAFNPLPIADVRRETAEAISLSFALPPSLRAHYAFAPGQYLTLRHEIDGEELCRAYSICSAPHEGELRIAIKRVAGGRFSTFAHRRLRPGMVLAVARPAGRFTTALDPEATRTWAAFAAGSGITPILSIVKAVLATEPKSRVVLIYGNRDAGAVMFRDGLDDLKDRALARLSVHHLLSRQEAGSALFHGRLDRARTRDLARLLCPPQAVHRYLICGPATMNDEVRAGLLAEGAAPGQILSERFRAGPAPRPGPRAAAHEAPHGLITVITDGRRRSLRMPQEGEALLDAAIRQGVELPFACKAGVCGACRARVVEGEAAMASNHALDRQEVEAGFVLACQARPCSPRLVLDFDRAWGGGSRGGPPPSPARAAGPRPLRGAAARSLSGRWRSPA
jgi:ring-1,2-phenylacetyl-CoA epoxidase subunit PaaE